MSLFEELKAHVEACFEKAENGESNITGEILNMEGMSGKKTRHFYNNLLHRDNVNYLEIGTWKGSSACSAMYGNKANVVCIDNWSQSGGPKNVFLTNFYKYMGENNARFIEQDSFAVDVSQLPKFNIYLYDGHHSEESHFKALTHYYNCLDDMFIYVVDDWNDKNVRTGTINAIRHLNLSVLYEKEIRLTTNDTHTPIDIAKETWWNGIYVAILQKQT
jgi:hypothetical protein